MDKTSDWGFAEESASWVRSGATSKLKEEERSAKENLLFFHSRTWKKRWLLCIIIVLTSLVMKRWERETSHFSFCFERLTAQFWQIRKASVYGRYDRCFTPSSLDFKNIPNFQLHHPNGEEIHLHDWIEKNCRIESGMEEPRTYRPLLIISSSWSWYVGYLSFFSFSSELFLFLCLSFSHLDFLNTFSLRPPFRLSLNYYKQLVEEFQDKIQLLVVYIREAHARWNSLISFFDQKVILFSFAE